MRYKLRHYQNKIKKSFVENFHIFKKRFERKKDNFVNKGHEKMTIMFIPHNEKKIFTFQISKFIISFFVILFIIIISTSSYTAIKNNAIKKEEQKLLTTYKGIRSDLIQFEKLTETIDNLVNEFNPEIEKVYELTSGKKDGYKIWNEEEIERDNSEKSDKKKESLPEEILTVKKIQKEMVIATDTIKTIKNFINIRSKVVKETPSIVSNNGHITSLFGWRRSPFSTEREFHTGIDIAAASGTPIRATAPGIVTLAGPNGGYGNCVRIKHKYGFETIYGHCRSLNTYVEEHVKQGDIIGYVGQTGQATGNHCHYEIRLGGVAINPYPYMSRIW